MDATVPAMSLLYTDFSNPPATCFSERGSQNAAAENVIFAKLRF